MPRVPMIAGNWKMNKLRREALDLARAIVQQADGIAGVDKVICPPHVFLHEIGAAVEGSTVKLGAQDLFWEEQGAYTGEVSVTQVAEAAEYVIIGHSERRQYFGETDETVSRKLQAALAHGLKPIMCVGEVLQQRQEGMTEQVLLQQVRGGLAGVQVGPEFVVAYEPVWAIGTGLAADGATAQEAVGLIRRTLREIAGTVAGDVRILYGGSVTAENIAEFVSQPDIDGGLVGGASLKPDGFSQIIKNTAAVRASA